MSAKKIIIRTPKEMGEDTTFRFLIAMERIVSKREGSKIRTVKDFALSIACDYTYLSKIHRQDNNLNVTVAMCCMICQKHGLNGDWLLTGRGEMFGDVTMLQRIINLETAAKETEHRLNQLEGTLGTKSGTDLPKKHKG